LITIIESELKMKIRDLNKDKNAEDTEIKRKRRLAR